MKRQLGSRIAGLKVEELEGEERDRKKARPGAARQVERAEAALLSEVAHTQ